MYLIGPLKVVSESYKYFDKINKLAIIEKFGRAFEEHVKF